VCVCVCVCVCVYVHTHAYITYKYIIFICYVYDQAHHNALAALPTTEGPSEKPKETKPTPANPGHILMCGHAIVLGAVEATGKLVATGKIECFTEDLKATAKEAASVGSPVGGYIMREHILKEESASA